ncbi:hypothetical protein MMC28_010867 [Mycoblastus sanguinarius]|nr:hypothetical protein [Mycoblastus sanguinarius]
MGKEEMSTSDVRTGKISSSKSDVRYKLNSEEGPTNQHPPKLPSTKRLASSPPARAFKTASRCEPQAVDANIYKMNIGNNTNFVYSSGRNFGLASSQGPQQEQFLRSLRPAKASRQILDAVDSDGTVEDKGDEDTIIPEKEWDTPQYRSDSCGNFYYWTGEMNGKRRVYRPLCPGAVLPDG